MVSGDVPPGGASRFELLDCSHLRDVQRFGRCQVLLARSVVVFSVFPEGGVAPWTFRAATVAGERRTCTFFFVLSRHDHDASVVRPINNKKGKEPTARRRRRKEGGNKSIVDLVLRARGNTQLHMAECTKSQS